MIHSKIEAPDLHGLGPCRDEDPELFFPFIKVNSTNAQVDKAKEVCGRCPVKADCLTWAIENGEDFGIWGGMTEQERRAYRQLGGTAINVPSSSTNSVA